MAISCLQSPTPFSFYEIPASRRSAFPRNDSAELSLQIRARGEIQARKPLQASFLACIIKRNPPFVNRLTADMDFLSDFVAIFAFFYLLYCVMLNATLVI